MLASGDEVDVGAGPGQTPAEVRTDAPRPVNRDLHRFSPLDRDRTWSLIVPHPSVWIVLELVGTVGPGGTSR